MKKVILFMCDALRDDVARQHMGYMQHLVEQNAATRWRVQAGLPTLSRPCYETLHTGVPAAAHGVVLNYQPQPSTTPSIFSAVRAAGGRTGAAAYHWIHELYNGPFDPVLGREVDDEACMIQHGRFYAEDDFPDIACFCLGGLLLARYQPDYLLVHPMGLDTIGHAHGGDSREYADQVIVQDQLLAAFVPRALAAGYTVVVTGDHGMSSQRNHNGTGDDVRCVPLYWIPADGRGQGDTGAMVSQLAIAPTVLHTMGVPVPPTMMTPPLPVTI
jgi:predicted AlkP superfamily pyrophosphatase or phosphodiesterase